MAKLAIVERPDKDLIDQVKRRVRAELKKKQKAASPHLPELLKLLSGKPKRKPAYKSACNMTKETEEAREAHDALDEALEKIRKIESGTSHYYRYVQYKCKSAVLHFSKMHKEREGVKHDGWPWQYIDDETGVDVDESAEMKLFYRTNSELVPFPNRSNGARDQELTRIITTDPTTGAFCIPTFAAVKATFPLFSDVYIAALIDRGHAYARKL
jgi:hypothetical protein